MQTENSGSSQDKKQEETKRIHDSMSGVDPDAGGNEYTAAFILYCQKTLDNFRRIYGDMYASEAGSVFGSSFGFSPSFSSSPGPGAEPENDEFDLDQDDESDEDDDDKEREALRELSEQFEQMLKAKAEFEDNDLDLDEDDDEDDDKEREALRELSKQFEQMLKAKAEFEDNDLDLDEDDETDDDKEKEELEEFFEQFEQMFNTKTESKNNERGLEQDGKSQSDDKEKEELEEFFEQFEQMLKNEVEPGDNPLGLEQDGQSQSRGYQGKEALKELLGQFEQMLNTEVEPGNEGFALGQGVQSNGYNRKEEPNVMGASSPLHSQGQNDAEIDQALSGVGEVVKSAKENLSIVEAFWEEPETERAKLLAKAGITQEEFEQIVTRAGSHLYDVKDCLEGWGDLSMLPETYEQLLLANNQLSEVFEKMYGKSSAGVLDKRKDITSEEDDDWELEDSDGTSDWELDDDDDWEFDDDDDDDDMDD